MAADRGPHTRWQWALAHLAVLLLAVIYGSAAPVLLAIALPLALEFSPLRDEPAYPTWLLATLSGAVALWLNAGGLHPGYEGLPALMSGIGLLLFLLRSSRTKPYLLLLSAQIWLVSYLSSGHGSGDSMIEWLRHLGLTPDGASSVTHAFRKTVHFTFYGSVAWAALRAAQTVKATRAGTIRTGLLAALSLACFDELRQTSYANRTGSGWDVLLDLSGAVVFVGLSEAWRRRRR